MKKIKNLPKLIKIQKRRLKHFLRNSGNKNLYSGVRRRNGNKNLEVFDQLGYLKIFCPNNFSMVNNTDEMIAFFNFLKTVIYSGRSVFLDFSKIKKVTNDGLIVLLSVIQDNKVPKNVVVQAKQPRNPKLRKRLRESGISEETSGLESVVPPKYGRFRQKNSLTADTEAANELIQFATRQIFGQRISLKDVQRILGECIDNTTYHANPEQRLAERWWGTVFCDDKKKIAYFSVLDNGIGIIESLKVSWIRNIELLKYKNNAELMRDIFEVGILSSTGEKNRGKGLPSIYQARKRNQFSRLIVISNNVYVDFDYNKYRILKNAFSGTFFYWEVRNGNYSAS